MTDPFSPPLDPGILREYYFAEAYSYIPKLIELADRNRLSSTYGCFDRAYWHYRTIDFPSGMYQEAVLPLAIVYNLEHPQNVFYRQDRIKELVTAGIEFARQSSHRDGSCDDYFPYERASGATAFSLYACTEACMLLDLRNSDLHSFFKVRGRYLAGYGYAESGILSNHKALIVLALYNVYLVTKDEFFKEQASEKLKQLLTLQSPEGWFPEYEGCDPGYLTFTIDFLAKYYQKSRDESVLKPLLKAIEFTSYFMHPDGSFGGEYGSRNTFHFMPHGFELMGPYTSAALPTANSFLQSLHRQTRSYLEDDRIFIHYVYNYLQAYQDFQFDRPAKSERGKSNFFQHFKEAGFVVKRSQEGYWVISLMKGGVAKVYRGEELVLSDAGLTGVAAGSGWKFISQVRGQYHTEVNLDKIVIEGKCWEHKDIILTPWFFVVFRLFLLMIARFLPANFVRSMIQRKAILKKKKQFPLSFRKEISLKRPGNIRLEISLEDPNIKIQELWVTADSTYIYVVTSQPYQKGSLHPWIDLSSILPQLNSTGKASWEWTAPV